MRADSQGDCHGMSVLYFGNDWSAENRTSSHHIAERLADRMPLLYVESPGMRAPKASGRDLRKLIAKLAAAFQAPQPIGPRMWRMSTPQIPFRSLPFVNRLNRLLGQYLVRKAARHLGLRKAISWFAVPHPGPLAGTLGERLIVYYCIDDYAALPDIDSAEIGRMDEDLTRRADQVFVASPTLLERKTKLNPTTTLSPHGVDVALFAQASNPALAAANDTAQLRHPVIGFFGLIEARIDLDLIAYLARSRPEWTFLMIGRVATDVSAVKGLPNVLLVGPKPYRELADWARAFDVAIIPYRLTRQVFHANPLKLREYLATGKPVISVSTPEIARFAEHVRIADNPEGFLRSIEDALSSDSPEAARNRMRAVAEMSWENRVQQVLSIIENRIVNA